MKLLTEFRIITSKPFPKKYVDDHRLSRNDLVSGFNSVVPVVIRINKYMQQLWAWSDLSPGCSPLHVCNSQHRSDGQGKIQSYSLLCPFLRIFNNAYSYIRVFTIYIWIITLKGDLRRSAMKRSWSTVYLIYCPQRSNIRRKNLSYRCP